MKIPHRTTSGGVGLKLLLALVFLAAALALAWMIGLPLVVTAWMQDRTGCGAELGRLYANPFTARLAVQHLVLTNPPTFPRRDFVDVRALEVEASPASLFGDHWVVDRAVVDVAAVTIVRDAQGQVNVRRLEERLGRAPPGGPRPGPPPTGRKFLIRRLDVRLDRVVVVDYSGGRPVVRTFALNFHHAYTDVTSARQLAEPLAAAFGDLGGALEGMLPEWTALRARTGGLLQDAGRKTGEALKGFFESLEKRFKK